MTPERYQKVNQFFHEALEKSPEERDAFLRVSCGEDEELRAEVEEMLRAHGRANGFLEALPQLSESLLTLPARPLIGRKLGRYRVVAQLGKGGMGEVFLAEDLTLGRRVALKLIRTESARDRDRLQRFEKEAKAASALNHPNILTIHEIGQVDTEDGSLNFIASEYIEGETIRTRLSRGSLPIAEAIEAAIQIASALQTAHAAGIVHRDIKPENLMLRPDGIVKVLDFGLVKLTEEISDTLSEGMKSILQNQTQPGMILGTTSYLSPEQARGVEVDSRSDLWSLGVVVYEMIAGRRPFNGTTHTDIMLAIVDRSPTPIRELRPQVPAELERILEKSLQKKREERYQTAHDLIVDLKTLKNQLLIDSELARLSNPSGQKASGPGTPLSSTDDMETRKQLVQNTFSDVPQPTLALPARRKLFLLLLGGLVAAAIMLFVFVQNRPTGTAPAAQHAVPGSTREINYTLIVQRMRDGQPYREPFEATGKELFEDGWKFRFRFESPQAGFLYLLNEGPVAEGAFSYQYLFPFPKINNGLAELSPNTPLLTGWYVVGDYQGTERLQLVWSATPVPELEAAKGVVNPEDKGLIRQAAQLNAVRDFLRRNASSQTEAQTNPASKQTRIRGAGEVFLHTIELEHR